MLSPAQNKNTKKIKYAISSGLVLFIFFGISFPEVVHAVGVIDFLGDTFADAIKGILYAIFVAVGSFVSIAVGLFEYAIDPLVYGPNGLFNKVSVYNMWKFIRDFFNLFFILTLLYTAFTIVFQIAGNYKKTLLSIVLAALFVNFSFPLSRVMIDATNVPMYYFANLIMSSTGGSATSASATLGPALSASGLKDILIPQETQIRGMTVSQILLGIIFLFVFMVTLMVLAVLFVVRMMALLVLVMFSSVGFAGSVIPGMKQYSDMWWDKFRQYALFGPAAMFMLYIATQLFSEISKDNTKQALNIATAANATSQSTSFLASAGMYSITIIMLWIAIGLANSMSIIGASAIAGRGQQFLKWTGKKGISGVTYMPRKVGTGLGQGLKSGFNDTKIGKWFAAPSRVEAYAKGAGRNAIKPKAGEDYIAAAKSEYKTELQKFHAQQVYKKVKDNKENKINNSTLLQELKTGDEIEKQAAALTLAENKAIDNIDVLRSALEAVGSDRDHVNTILKAASDKATAGMSVDDFNKLAQSQAFAKRDSQGRPLDQQGRPVINPDGNTKYSVDDSQNSNFRSFKSKMKDSGQLHTVLEYERAQNLAKEPGNPEKAMADALVATLGKLSGSDLGKQESIHIAIAERNQDGTAKNPELVAYVNNIANNNPTTYQEALRGMSITNVERWRDAGISPAGKTTDEGARMREKMQQAKKETKERRG